ncbi:hypothetical protein FRC17_005755, partial [Serendipita sp. 399]
MRWNLIAVCSRWRQILLATPLVWRDVRIDHTQWTGENEYERFLYRLELQLSRSGSEQLQVQLFVLWGHFLEHRASSSTGWNISRRRPDLKKLAMILERAAPFGSWKTLNLISCDPALLEQMQLDRMGGFTNLEVLHVKSLNDPLLPIVNGTVTHSLKHFEYVQPHTPVDGQAFLLGISNILNCIIRLKLPSFIPGSTANLTLPPTITTLHLSGYSIPDTILPHVRILQMLSVKRREPPLIPGRFPNLTSLTLSTRGGVSSPPSTSITPLDLPYLEQLTTHL